MSGIASFVTHSPRSTKKSSKKKIPSAKNAIPYLAYFAHIKGFWTRSMEVITALLSDMDWRNRLSASLNWSELLERQTRVNSSLSGTLVQWEGTPLGAKAMRDCGDSGSKGIGNSRGLKNTPMSVTVTNYTAHSINSNVNSVYQVLKTLYRLPWCTAHCLLWNVSIDRNDWKTRPPNERMHRNYPVVHFTITEHKFSSRRRKSGKVNYAVD